MVLQMQPGGTLVACAVPGFRRSVAASLVVQHAGVPNAWLAIQDDRNLVIHRGPFPQGGGVLWATNPFGR